jgi:hypothetical protein
VFRESGELSILKWLDDLISWDAGAHPRLGGRRFEPAAAGGVRGVAGAVGLVGGFGVEAWLKSRSSLTLPRCRVLRYKRIKNTIKRLGLWAADAMDTYQIALKSAVRKYQLGESGPPQTPQEKPSTQGKPGTAVVP